MLIALLVHALFAWFVWSEMQVHRQLAATQMRTDDVLYVDFTPTTPVAPPPPALPSTAHPLPPRPVAPPPPRRPPAREPATKDAIQMQLPSPAPVAVPAAKLYDSAGALRLPASAHSAPAAGYAPPQGGDTRIMRNANPIKYKTTRFNQYFPPVNENAGSAIGRHVVNAVTQSVDVDVHGAHMQCSILGCVNPPPPPSKKDGDVRLSMPSKPLAKDPHPPSGPSLEQCIARYRDGKSLPYGCPADTPSRAVDEEIKERATRRGSH